MHLFAKLDGNRFNENENINSYINTCVITSEKAKVATSFSHIDMFSKLGIPMSEAATLMPEKLEEQLRNNSNNFWKNKLVISIKILEAVSFASF